MNLKDKIYYKYLTLKEFEDMVESNISLCNELEIIPFQEAKTDGLTGRLYLKDKLIYEKVFTGEHLHTMLAKMHYNWSLILQKHIKIKRENEYREKMEAIEALGGQNYDVVDEPEDDRLTMGERAKRFKS